MPVLAGQIVESSAASDRFLWDFRKTIADLIATEHYGQLEDHSASSGAWAITANRTRKAAPSSPMAWK